MYLAQIHWQECKGLLNIYILVVQGFNYFEYYLDHFSTPTKIGRAKKNPLSIIFTLPCCIYTNVSKKQELRLNTGGKKSLLFSINQAAINSTSEELLVHQNTLLNSLLQWCKWILYPLHNFWQSQVLCHKKLALVPENLVHVVVKPC